jgi:hypothetical protein
MANEQSFTPDEWTKILESAMLVGMAISATDPSGLWGTVKEALASRSALDKSMADPGSNELVRAVIADFEKSEGQEKIKATLRKSFAEVKPSEFVERALDNLRQVSTIVDAKAPDDAAEFKTWLCSISQAVAEAAKEGGFFGVGGVRVSDSERATLAEIAKALGTS